MKNKIWQGLIIRLALTSSIIFQLVDLVSILVTKPRNQKAEGVVIKITKMGNTKSRFIIRFYTEQKGTKVEIEPTVSFNIEQVAVGHKLNVFYNEEEPEKAIAELSYELYMDYISILTYCFAIPAFTYVFIKVDKLFFGSSEGDVEKNIV